MRIAVVHSFYDSSQPSGENLVVIEQARILVEAGHDVRLFTRATDVERHRPLYAPRAGLRVATGWGGSPAGAIADFAPDIVHVHNLFPNIGTHWLAGWPGPLVATAHNFRYACANGLLLRDGATCTLCPDGDRLAGVRHACYRGSRLATLPLALANRDGPAGHPVVRRADRLVVGSGRSLELFARFGVPRSRLALVPSCVSPSTEPDETAAVDSLRDGPPRFAAVGRLDEGKGFPELLSAWPEGLHLDVVGSGPLADVLRTSAGPTIRFVGAVPNEDWRRRLGGYTAVVLPSTASEGGIPITLLEAWSAGVPVVARRGNSGADAVDECRAGTTYDDAEGLAVALSQVVRERDAFGVAASDAYRRRHTPAVWSAAMLAVYRQCQGERGADTT